ncbi:MAG: DsbC family protein [Gammaproteobacteria bacterium]|nr:DsbC family protein [Gammaproteobacteria bacterium]
MYKKIVLSSLVCLGLLTSNVGCGKKSEEGSGQAQPSVSSSEVRVDTAQTEFGKNVNKSEAEAVVAMLQTEFPQMKASKVEKAPFNGFYQVLADGEVLYVSSDAKLLFVGDVIAIDKSQQKRSLTEEVRKSVRLDVLNSLKESDMVVFKPKKVEHVVTVFTDVDCGYCRKFHSEMQAYLEKGIEVRYMAFPRAGKDSDSYNKAVTVWCAKDQKAAMNKAKLTEDFKADSKLCDKKSVIDKSLEVVRKLGLNGTPALLLEDGTLVPGYMPADKLSFALDQNKKRNEAVSANAKNGSTSG